MSQREAEPQSLRLGQRVGEVRWQGEVVLELVDIEADEVSSCRRQLGAGQSQRLGQPGDKGTDEPGRFPSDQAAVERNQHDFPFDEQICQSELRLRLAENIP